MDVDNVTGSNAQLVVHVGCVVVQRPTCTDAWSVFVRQAAVVLQAAIVLTAAVAVVVCARVVDLTDVTFAFVFVVAGDADGGGRGCATNTAAHKATAEKGQKAQIKQLVEKCFMVAATFRSESAAVEVPLDEHAERANRAGQIPISILGMILIM